MTPLFPSDIPEIQHTRMERRIMTTDDTNTDDTNTVAAAQSPGLVDTMPIAAEPGSLHDDVVSAAAAVSPTPDSTSRAAEASTVDEAALTDALRQVLDPDLMVNIIGSGLTAPALQSCRAGSIRQRSSHRSSEAQPTATTTRRISRAVSRPVRR